MATSKQLQAEIESIHATTCREISRHAAAMQAHIAITGEPVFDWTARHLAPLSMTVCRAFGPDSRAAQMLMASKESVVGVMCDADGVISLAARDSGSNNSCRPAVLFGAGRLDELPELLKLLAVMERATEGLPGVVMS